MPPDRDVNTLAEAMRGADMFLGLSAANIVTPDMLRTMNKRPIVFALANPDPEISYELAMESRDDIIMATGRSDHPNQVNNVLGFPYIFRGAHRRTGPGHQRRDEDGGRTGASLAGQRAHAGDCQQSLQQR